jgi:hypothetical protein
VCLGDSGAALAAERTEKVFNALSDEGQTIDEIARKTELSAQAVKRCITALDVRAKREGAGVKGAPHRYSRNSIPPQAEP